MSHYLHAELTAPAPLANVAPRCVLHVCLPHACSVLDLLLQAALGGSGQCCWQEPHASLLKGLIDSCPSVVAQQLSAVLQALGAAVKQPGTAKSTVFGQLLMSMLKSYAGVLSQQQVEQLQNVVVGTSTFLTKALSSKLQQLLL